MRVQRSALVALTVATICYVFLITDNPAEEKRYLQETETTTAGGYELVSLESGTPDDAAHSDAVDALDGVGGLLPDGGNEGNEAIEELDGMDVDTHAGVNVTAADIAALDGVG